VCDPVGLLRHLRAFSAQTTRLIIEVPILESQPTQDISGFFSWMHTTHFSRSSLRNTLARAGWRVSDWQMQPYNGFRLLAEPTEPNDRITGDRDDHEMAQRMVNCQRDAYARAEAILEKTHRSFTLWGAGLHTEMLYQRTCLKERLPFRIFDRDVTKWGTTWRGVPIVKPTAYDDDNWEHADLVISSYSSQAAIRQAALDLEIYPERIVTLYDAPEVY